MKLTEKIKYFNRKQLGSALLCSVITGAVIIAAVMIKLYAFGNNTGYSFLASLGTVTLIVMLLMACLTLYLFTADKFIVIHSNYYFAYMAILALAAVTGIFLSLITPLLIPVAFASLLIFPISRKNSSSFVINTVCTLIIILTCLYEYLITDGQLYTVMGESGGRFLWELFSMCLFDIAVGGILPYCIRYKTKRTRYILASFIFNCVVLGLIALLIFGNENVATTFDSFWLVIIAVFIPLVTSLIIVPVIESIFNLVTDNRLVELTDSKQPLIARLIAEAPGTFNHSLVVSNFAEICANAIGEDPYLARAAAYYHDIGKLESPACFAENQSGDNPLDELLPEVSAQIIRNHAENGFKLCEKHRIPEEIKRVTVEHHGTMPIKIFYERAKSLTDSDIDIKEYSYRGAIPTSKISAIIMVCDSGEAAIRAMDKPDGERIDKLLRTLINERLQSGQFDNCDISIKELNTIRLAIIEAYGGLYHKRIKYPGGEKS